MITKELQNQIIAVIKEAGKIIMSAKLESSEIYEKTGDTNYVTKYDKEVQAFLIGEFQKLLPQASYLAEEDDVKHSVDQGFCFIIDPIDGTTNFIYDYHHSCISVGLAEDGKIVFGAVYNPYVQELFRAALGEGAYLNDKPIHCSPYGLDRNIASFGCTRYNTPQPDQTFEIAKGLYYKSMGLRDGGSSTLDLVRIASGSNGLYMEFNLYPWDYAAASLILQEAGGKITKLDGSEVSFQTQSDVLAGAPLCWEEGMEILKKVLQK